MVSLLDTWQCPTQSVLYATKLAHEKVWEKGKSGRILYRPEKKPSMHADDDGYT